MVRNSSLLMAWALLSSLSAYSESTVLGPVKSPAQVAEELDRVQQDFDIAKNMFIPWYTGPLITSSANNVPMGHVNLQPYLFFNVNYATFDKHRRSHSMPSMYVLNPLLIAQVGVTKWLDATIQPQGFFRWQDGHFGDNFADLPLQFGLHIYNETPYVPSIRLVLTETFPTGAYHRLDPAKEGLDATGQGVYSTGIGLNLSKVFWWLKLHPVCLRLANQVAFADNKSHVTGFNAFGGGYGTRGKVKVGTSLSSDFGVEVSLTQKWVFAVDVVYNFTYKSTFSGAKGKDAAGNIALVGSPLSDQLSIAPAIEYNVNDSAGFIGGVWFSVTGRNSANFASATLSYTVLF